MKQKVSQLDYYKSSQTNGKIKWNRNQLNQIKENKYSFKTCFKPTWHEIKTWS